MAKAQYKVQREKVVMRKLTLLPIEAVQAVIPYRNTDGLMLVKWILVNGQQLIFPAGDHICAGVLAEDVNDTILVTNDTSILDVKT